MLLLDHRKYSVLVSLKKDNVVNNIFPKDSDFTIVHPRIKKHDWSFDTPQMPRFKIKQFVFGFILAFAIGMILWPLLPRYYQAQATLIFRSPEQSGKLTFLKQDLDEKAIQSELDILSSPPLTAEVLKRLNLLRDPEFSSSSSAFPIDFVSNALSANADPDPAHAAITRLSIQHDRRSYTIRVGFLLKDPRKSAEMTSLLATVYLENLTDRKQKLLARDVDIARSRLLSTAFRQSQLTNTINELTQLASTDVDKTTLSELIAEKSRLAQTIDGARAQIEEALVRQQNTEPDAELIAPALYPASPLFPNPLIFAVALIVVALMVGVGVGLLDINRLLRIVRQ